MTQDKTKPACGASSLHAEFEDMPNPLTPVMDALLMDARRYRWLVTMFQAAYDGNDLEIGDMIVGCQMNWGRRNERRMAGVVHWTDERGAPLGLSAAIDMAMALSSNATLTRGAQVVDDDDAGSTSR